MIRRACVLMVTVVLAACGQGESEGDSPSAATIAVNLVAEMESALEKEDPDSLDRLLEGPHHEVLHEFWFDYCPGYCSSSAGPPSALVDAREIARSEDGATAVVVVDGRGAWAQGEDPTTVRRILRLRLAGEPKIDLLFDGWWADLQRRLPQGGLAPLTPAGTQLAQSYLALRDEMFDTGRYPSDSEFAPGRYTDRYAEVAATFKKPEPWEVTKVKRRLLDGESAGFTVNGSDGDLHCAVFEYTSVTRHAAGEPIRPQPVLGDYEHMIEDDLYREFVLRGYDSVCLVESEGGPPAVITASSDRVDIQGTKAFA